MKIIQRIALALVIIGAINWGLIGLFQFDLVATLFGGQDAAFSRVIYTLVGLSGLVCLTLLFAPMDEEVERRENAQGNRNLNYSTEFGEENDLSELKDENDK
ncbi:DUF378 domain-containing protein [Cytobacillus purgationiresistens]|uniref:Uncharacterized membrane protein YuzA (DUF378 family) n=1 Tax=Cytobacillus purgationiresistens TaxID=863449 RepID=A0ABU0AGV8_9BACI|nr:DUF378 domain-containing protein [Cytobacillus purgationiresistens]MDQ0270489.1 uncharacterized membrane protein YuzA (DUF378 family) [Cytobacillus purgationiresistens]